MMTQGEVKGYIFKFQLILHAPKENNALYKYNMFCIQALTEPQIKFLICLLVDKREDSSINVTKLGSERKEKIVMDIYTCLL